MPRKKRGGRHPAIRLDQAMRQLFRLSRKVTLRLLNGLFDETFAEAEVTDIHYEDNRFTTREGQQLQGDLFLAVQTHDRIYRYHVEFQTLHDRTMAIRMFRYGMEKALQAPHSAETELTLEYPAQRVIVLEENGNIPDSLSLLLKFGDGLQVRYSVPVMKYWEWSAEQLLARGLYALLPLQVFGARAKLKRLARSKRPDAEKRVQVEEQFRQLQVTLGGTLRILDELYERGELPFDDLEHMLRIVTYIAEHLYAQYDPYPHWNEEVDRLIKTLIDPKIWERGKREGRKEGKIEGKIEGKLEVARNLLALGAEPELIRHATGLSDNELEQLRDQRR
ncbi:RpnC/YadD family protein [Paenibacillus cymbidii]|uniref:Rpn family recombination-promoting nuclease/putative transposase n=1 Tax=Paenibacillus cymbidii TaxID=1639034 RepID=UPI0010817123|nr:Rpn family recombination-promoting nuclease/putative transposase [Paenibacillus cymbidii]